MRPILALAVAALVLASCNRNIEPYVPGEKPRQPDLSHIFPPGAEEAARLESAPAAGGAAPAGAAAGADTTANAPPIRGTVSLDPSVASRVPPGAVLYVIARTADTGPPLAVKRFASPHFPVDFTVGPGDRMIRAFPFAGAIKLTARLDADGNAASRSPGDIEGAATSTHAPGDSGVKIVLDRVLETGGSMGGAPAGGGAMPAGPAARSDATANAPPIRGTVSLDPSVASRVPPGAVLYLIARTADTGPPLAVKRFDSPQFPVTFSIGPDDRMIRAFAFAGAIKLSARLDADGNASTRSPGDLQGAAPGTHAPGDAGVKIVLDQVL